MNSESPRPARSAWRVPIGRSIGLGWIILAGWLLIVWATAGGVGVDATQLLGPIVGVATLMGIATLALGHRGWTAYASIIVGLLLAAWAFPYAVSTDQSFAGSWVVTVGIAAIIGVASLAVAIWDR
jgi:hypothetical protein